MGKNDVGEGKITSARVFATLGGSIQPSSSLMFDLVSFLVLQPRNRRKMNLTRVQIDNDLVRFKVLQPRNRRKLNLTRVKVDNDLVRFLIVCYIGELLVEAHEFSFYYSVRGDIAISGYVG